MSNTLHFKAFCFEAYKAYHKLTGKQALSIFTKYKIFEYLALFYDVLHTTGRDYLISNIDDYIKAKIS